MNFYFTSLVTCFLFYPFPIMSSGAEHAASSMSMPEFMKESYEEGKTQEFKDFLSTLPTVKGVTNQIYEYQGFWHSAALLKGILKFQRQFSVQPSDQYLVTIPKSGSTWLKALCFAIVNRVHYPPSSNKQHPLLIENPHALVPFVELMYTQSQDPDFTCLGSPRFLTTHLPYVSLPEPVIRSKCKIVYLCRNPKDTLISLWFFRNRLETKDYAPVPLEEMVDMFCKGNISFGPFWDHALGYWKQSLENPERVFFLKYEDMKREPMVHLRKLAEFLGFPFSTKEENEGVLEEMLKLCSFGNLSNLEVNKHGHLVPGVNNNVFFRRGEVGDWVNHLTPEMIERLDRITEEKLHGSGLKF